MYQLLYSTTMDSTLKPVLLVLVIEGQCAVQCRRVIMYHRSCVNVIVHAWSLVLILQLVVAIHHLFTFQHPSSALWLRNSIMPGQPRDLECPCFGGFSCLAPAYFSPLHGGHSINSQLALQMFVNVPMGNFIQWKYNWKQVSHTFVKASIDLSRSARLNNQRVTLKSHKMTMTRAGDEMPM